MSLTSFQVVKAVAKGSRTVPPGCPTSRPQHVAARDVPTVTESFCRRQIRHHVMSRKPSTARKSRPGDSLLQVDDDLRHSPSLHAKLYDYQIHQRAPVPASTCW